MTPATAAITAPAFRTRPPADPESSPSSSLSLLALSVEVGEESSVVEGVAEPVAEDWVDFAVVEEP